MKFTKLPIPVEATQWFKNGDHPLDYGTQRRDPVSGSDGIRDPASGTVTWSVEHKRESDWEGEIVRRYRHPGVPGKNLCKNCGGWMHEHGWIDTLEGGHIVCPGDWIITGVKGEHYPCKPDIFEQTYEPACETCGGVGLIGGHSGQTPESYEEHAEPCPDCASKAAPISVEDAREKILRDLMQHVSEVSDHTPDSFRTGVIRLANRAHFALASQAAPATLKDGEYIEGYLDSMNAEIGCELSDCEIGHINGHEVVMVRARDSNGGPSRCVLYVDKCMRAHKEAIDLLSVMKGA